MANIKRKLFVEECAISGDGCDAQLTAEDACSTAHCLATYEDWECSEALYDLWDCVLSAQEGRPLDYDACIRALADEE